MENNTITRREKSLIAGVFNNGGYVLDFSNATFSDFTIDVVGFSVQDKYGMSKGKSLMEFFNNESDRLAAKLLEALVHEFEDSRRITGGKINDNERKLLDECSNIVERLKGSSQTMLMADSMGLSTFNSDYINQQVGLMYDLLDESPLDAIGKAKELIESCAKTVLRERDVDLTPREDFSDLVKQTLKTLNISRDSIPDDKKGSECVKRILSSLTTVVLGVNDLRNNYGSGHGRDKDFTGLSSKHARLTVGAATTSVAYIWETHQEMK